MLKDKILNRKHKLISSFFKKELTNEEQNYLINKYNSNNIQEICYRELYNIIEQPKCKYCGNLIPFINFSKGYQKTCSDNKCRYKQKSETMMLNYGVENAYQLNKSKQKIKETNIKKYGVENVSQSEEIKKKKEETCLKNYGFKYGLQTEYCKIKRKEIPNEQIVKKYKNTCLERYNVENVSQLEEIKKKKEETCLKHWGVTNFWKDPNNRKNFHTKEAHRKEYETKKKNGTLNSSSIEKQAYNLLKEKYSDVKYQYRSKLYPFNCDFYIPSLDLYIEYNEHWTHGFKPFENTKEDQQKLELWKSKNTKYYNIAIKTWTIRDVYKRNLVKQNNINWIEFWNINELINWLNN